MIVNLRNEKVWPDKWNWIDHNRYVFGYYCGEESTGYWQKLYDTKTNKVIRERNITDVWPYDDGILSGLNYHFDKSRNIEKIDNDGCADTIRVWLAPDDPDVGNELMLECIADHNGYYGHDFSFGKLDHIVDAADFIDIDLKLCMPYPDKKHS